MGRVAFSWNAFKQAYDGVVPVNGGGGTQGGIGGPGAGRYNGNPTPTDLNSLTDDYVAAQSGGSGRATFYTTPTWQVYANALVQLPVEAGPVRGDLRPAGPDRAPVHPALRRPGRRA